ncbi:ABC transporter substrate-binding protein [Psychromicrobium xiongbiense]|uniref:ABC transporter substrate-binding protein n=1 Tax=Psychromicrobium xiongbiense TaxID=3051184 RepID=UPI0025566A24|nr:ABC transporter substrate-binding protein [Psychromicrobium sp. YIM S02556]
MSPRSRVTRVAVAAVSIAVAASLALTACGGSTPAPATTATVGGDLVVGVTADPNTLLPWKATQFQAINILQNIYGTLTEFDKDLNVVPGLAESWKTSDDGKTVTFSLRSGVTFANGAPFTSADVTSSLGKIQLEATAAVARTSLSSVASMDAPDAKTVVLHLKAPDASLPANLASVNMAILSAADTDATLTDKPNGTGPYSFKARVPSQSLSLVRNASYWGAKPGLDSVEFRVIPDQNSIVSAMQSGNVQMATFDDPLVAKTAEGPNVTVAKTPQLSYHTLQLNAKKGDLTDVNVRLAIQCAIDRKQVLDTAALGEGSVVGPITSPAYLSDPNSRPCPTRDLAKAADYLKKAGKTSVTLKTIVSQGEYATSVNEAQNLKSQLAEAHITLNLEVLESGTYVNRWVAADFDAAVALNGGRPDPDGMYGRYFTSTGNLNKVAGYSSPELDALFAQGKATTDVAARKDIYKKVSDNLENNAAWIWLFSSYTYTATLSSVHGFVPMANQSLQFLRTTSVTK